MLQDKFRSKEEFSQRTDALAARLRVPLNKLKPYTGFSERMLYFYRKNPDKISKKAWGKLLAAEMKAGIAVAPAAADDRYSKRAAAPMVPPMRINPGYAIPPANPTREDVEEYIRACLDVAERVPGGVAFLHFTLTGEGYLQKLRQKLKSLEAAPASD